MSNVAKLKKKAAELEERRQYDKALAVYEQVLDQMSESEGDVDVSLFNRVGDLTLRQGRVTQAVSFYERAVDLYTDGGFFNNAIALCNKILRNAPGRTTIYYKLGKISARKGFTSDAKLNFLEYADRMQKAGHWQEAFSALQEFADLCPDQDDVRLMLAEQLTRQDRKAEALAQLQILYGKYVAEGRTTEANATLARMRAIDPDIVPQVSQQAAPEKSGDLVFLKVNYDEQVPRPDEKSERFDTQDPRASGGMRILRGSEEFARPLTPTTSDIIRTGAGYDIAGDDAVPAAHGDNAKQRAPGEAPMHDLALAGILPVLDTPGLNTSSLPDIDTIEEEPDEVSEIESMLGPDYGELISRTEDSIIGTAADGSTASTVELLEPLDIERTQHVTGILESRVSDSGMHTIHGSQQVAGPEAEGNAGADSVFESSPSTQSASQDMGLTSALSRESLKSIAWSVLELQSLLKVEPQDFTLRRRLGEVLVEEGRRAEGLAELDQAMNGLEETGSISDAIAIVEEILRLEPDSIRHHQKRVEYSFRNSDQSLLIDSYLELADALFRTSQLAKASVVYERVLELAPENTRASYALKALVASDSEDAAASDESVATGSSVAATATAEVAEDFVNLGDLLREDDEPRSTRMVVEDEEPSGDEDADFAEMLEKFKRGLAENVDEEDYESHYDLGVAFREMGLLDESIAQFQRALRGTKKRVRTLEALGQCFVERSQFQVATNVLERALNEAESSDENLVGVLYLLGYASEAMQKYREAIGYYQRVFMVDIQFRDVTARIAALETMLK